jgi:hypothetical protein
MRLRADSARSSPAPSRTPPYARPSTADKPLSLAQHARSQAGIGMPARGEMNTLFHIRKSYFLNNQPTNNQPTALIYRLCKTLCYLCEALCEGVY